MILRIDHPQFFYDLFYQLSSLVVILIFLIEGSRRNLPWISLLLIAVTTRFFVITGSKLAGINSNDVNFFIQHFSLPPIHSKNMAGALFFGLVGLGLSKLILRIKYPVLDVFAIAVPFGMAIQRIGCLLTGCCFGIETSSPLGIQYGSNSSAFFHQFYSGRVSFADELSLHIHPVPLYFIISSLLVGILLLRFRNYWKRPGNLAFSGLVLILISWFVIEFFRDPLSNSTYLGNVFFGIKRIQIIYLILIPILIFTIFYREKHYVPKTFDIQENSPVLNALYLFTLIVLLSVTRQWFSTIEFTVILFVLIPASVGVLIQVISQFYTQTVRASVAFLILLSFVLMGQTLPEKEIYKSIKFGYSSGSFENYHNIGTGTGCDRASQSQYFYQKYRMVGAGYSITSVQGKLNKEYGLNGYIGSQTELAETSKIETTSMIFGLNPFVKFDDKWYGIEGGLHIGALRLTPPRWVEQETSKLPDTGTRKSPVLPQFYFRFGPKKIAFVSYKFADQFPSPFPGAYQSLEFGSGFGMNNGFNLRIGSDFADGAYFAAYIPIENKFVIEPLFQFGNSGSTSNEYDIHGIFSIGFHYRLGQKRENSQPLQ
jgi:prolipoprotein diacylglyceryltransferase